MSRPIWLPAPVQGIIGRVESAGYACWAVGGCVRDSLLGKTPSDWDLTSSATPEQLREVFADHRLVLNGEKHGTVGVIEGGAVYEITTFRVETGCSDHRHPDAVRFTGRITEDLARRDFTINAMAYHPQRGLLDCFGGEEDLRRGWVRCVGQPDRRFEEDALRILRALRFAASLGFALEEQTLAAMRRQSVLLKEISAERIQSELCRILAAPAAAEVLSVAPEVWGLLFGELAQLQKNARQLPLLPPDPVLRLCWLYGREGKSAAALCQKLRFSRADIQRSRIAFACWQQLAEQGEAAAQAIGLRRALCRFGKAAVDDALQLLAAQGRPLPQEALDRAESGVWLLSQLAVDGRALLEGGCPPGETVGQVLSQLLECCLEEQLPNERTALLTAARLLWEKSSR